MTEEPGEKQPQKRSTLKRKLVLTVAFVVVFFIGIGIGAAGKTKTVTTAAKTVTAATKTVTVPGAAKTITITAAAKTITTKVRANPKPAPASSSALHFSGNGGKTLPPVTVHRNSTLSWTNDGMIFQIFGGDTGVIANSQAHSGNTFLAAGTYTMQVNAVGNWTIKIAPG